MNTTDSNSTPNPASDRKLPLILGSILVTGLVIRCVIAFRLVNVFHGYEMFQEIEQGHRLAFGSGVVPFEFVYGYRSWLIPGIVAAVMKLCTWISSDPALYLYVLRLLAITFSLVPILCSYLIVSRIAGSVWGCIAAFLCAVWFQTVYFAPFLMPEVFAAYLTLIAVYLVSAQPARPSARASVIIGGLLGLAFCLRFQMAPALLLIGAWHARVHWRARWIPMTAAALAVVLPILGLLDFLTLGSPFQSVWLNFRENVSHGVADQFGDTSPLLYLFYLSPSLHYLPIAVLFGWLALMGAFRFPILALSALAIVIPHALVPHKEYRFVCFALMAMPILMGIGLGSVGEIASRHLGERAVVWLTAAILALAVASSAYEFRKMAWYRFTHNQGTLESFLAVRDYKELCGLGVADYPWHGTGGYSYLHRDVPVYFAYSLTGTSVAGLYGTDKHPELALATRVVLGGKTLVQYKGRELFQNMHAYNFLIGNETRHLPGYKQLRCFSSGPKPLHAACILERAGTCR